MIVVTPKLSISEDEISWSAIRASGPGGQHVNKASTAVQLRFDIERCLSLSESQKETLINFPDARISKDGIIVIRSEESRSQPRNREIAVQRLIELLQKAFAPRKPRRKTRPTKASVQQRLQDKRQKSQTKQARRKPLASAD